MDHFKRENWPEGWVWFETDEQLLAIAAKVEKE
jgi:hypothetical protein